MNEEQENLRTQTSCLLVLKKSWQNKIKELETLLIEENEERDEDQTASEVVESIDQLETAIINASADLLCFEKALKGAEMNREMCKHLCLDVTDEMAVEISSVDKANQMSVLAMILKNSALQTKYMGVLKELEDLQERVVNKQRESLEAIVEARELKQKLNNVGKEEGSNSKKAADMEFQLKCLLEENLQVYRMVSSMFQELIFCSKVDYSNIPEMKSLVLNLAKKIELEK